MGRPYAKELKELDSTLQWALSANTDSLSSVLRRNTSVPLISVGSGGSFSSAEIQAHFHRVYFGAMAISCTPMELLRNLPLDGQCSVWFQSASGNNIDIRRGFKHSVLNEVASVNALIGSKKSKLSDLAKKYSYTDLFEIDLPAGRDGFLATNSLFGLSIILLKSYLSACNKNTKIPSTINEIISKSISSISSISDLIDAFSVILHSDKLHVIYSPSLKSSALDIESKFVEAGLGSVHLSDIRNFAHGRHHWFDKVQSSAILSIVETDDATLSGKTLELLPAEIPKLQFQFDHEKSYSPIAGIILSLYLTYSKGLIKGIDPGKPKVPQYGSKIYRLSTNPGFDISIPKKEIAIRRKMAGSMCLELEEKLTQEHDLYIKSLKKNRIGGIVFDYDGTLVDSKTRGKPPAEELCTEINRLLEAGVRIAFATGRGKSIREELTSCLTFPEKYHDQIFIGYYNGAIIGTLGDDSCPKKKDMTNQSLISAYKKLSGSTRIKLVASDLESREYQITAEPKEIVSETFLWEYASSLIAGEKYSDIKIMRSSHSIDIVPKEISKLSVVKKLQNILSNNEFILCIGDRGRWPGNDCELLEHDFSLSVDETSLLKDRCWNLCPAGYKGTQGTLYYLKRLKLNKDGFIKMS